MDSDIVPIILIAGQSNSRGVGKVSDLSTDDQKLVHVLVGDGVSTNQAATE